MSFSPWARKYKRLLPGPMADIWVLPEGPADQLKCRDMHWNWNRCRFCDESLPQTKGLGPFLQTESDVPKGLCLLPSWVACSSVRAPRGNAPTSPISPCKGHLLSQTETVPSGLHQSWEEGLQPTSGPLLNFLLPGWFLTVPRVSLLPSPVLTSREKAQVPSTIKPRANILLLCDWLLLQHCPIMSQSPRWPRNTNQQAPSFNRWQLTKR